MNRHWWSDSKLSLVSRIQMSDSAVMITQPDHLYVERIAPEKNMARFMHLLFSRLCSARYLLRAWGRIGTRGRQMLHLFDNESWAVLLFLDVLRESA
ncbi:WGR domain-containing protein [Agrobacterium rosae]|uniref:WGR domain-containing protein n=2 Tax=Agrobacterium rosae TaxID=1972867 RepID=A0AAE5VM77_9HYPH|nr:WGR domain-containing protein [Agrobacterium rosae]KAA3513959.1 WGR domain-containing protein [Agrobacterium rosae]MQB50985.1 WGR domain-containing protein [Agrobacterium rosae]POO48810.1 WGR domain-containing protein [Agrobacterium rosae]